MEGKKFNSRVAMSQAEEKDRTLKEAGLRHADWFAETKVEQKRTARRERKVETHQQKQECAKLLLIRTARSPTSAHPGQLTRGRVKFREEGHETKAPSTSGKNKG